ncbi:Aquaporin-10 [Holothuria leucospilota]|uniref:Aquaporin-10 n=1 Tax=Holothuria leucospilota TaxID=206669 RepID=A0A9Q1C9V6_HOLLE|nr:Aquaporin-10 [Holothuria leucospilota]
MPSEEIVKKIQNKLGTSNDLVRCLLAEFIGTFVLVAIVDGGVASVITSGLSTLDQNLWLSLSSGLGVAFGIWTAYGVSGGHVNPSVTVGLATTGKFPWRRAPFYFMAQLLGAFVACCVCFLCYFDAINASDEGMREVNSTCGIFTTFPAGPHITLTTGFFEQIVNTGLMLFLIHVIGDSRNAGSPFNLAPLFYGLIVTAIILSYGVNAGSPLNPARDFAGRLMCAIAGYGPGVWAPHGKQWWWIATFGPLIGAAVGSLVYLLLVEIHHPSEDRSPKDGLIELREEHNSIKKEPNQNEDEKVV